MSGKIKEERNLENTVKPVINSHSKRRPKIGFKNDYHLMQVKVLQNAPREHSAMLSTFMKLQFAFKTFVLSIFEWPLKTCDLKCLLFLNYAICRKPDQNRVIAIR